MLIYLLAILYSASLDNTIRSWDPYDMACVSTMEETSSEISCMTYIPLAGLLVTGSDDGAVRFWNPASGSTIMLRGHENTISCMVRIQKLKKKMKQCSI